MNILSGADAAKQPANLDRLGQSYGMISGSESEPPMMWNANFAGPSYGFTTYGKTPLMLSMLGGIVGDSAVQRAHREWAQAWMFRHPSPWDYMFFMNRALNQDLGWFWNAWLFSTDRVAGWADAVTRGAAGAVCPQWAADPGDAECRHARQPERDRDFSRQRLVPRPAHLRCDSRFREASNHRSAVRSGLSLP
jgi:hypothetical protein